MEKTQTIVDKTNAIKPEELEWKDTIEFDGTTPLTVIDENGHFITIDKDPDSTADNYIIMAEDSFHMAWVRINDTYQGHFICGDAIPEGYSSVKTKMTGTIQIFGRISGQPLKLRKARIDEMGDRVVEALTDSAVIFPYKDVLAYAVERVMADYHFVRYADIKAIAEKYNEMTDR